MSDYWLLAIVFTICVVGLVGLQFWGYNSACKGKTPDELKNIIKNQKHNPGCVDCEKHWDDDED